MKRIALIVFVLFVAAIALANGHDAAPPAGAPEHGGDHGAGPAGEHAVVGADGTVYITKVTAAATSGTAPTVTVTAIRSTGTTAWTATLPSGAHDFELSDGNLLTVVEAKASDGTVTSTITAISTTTGSTSWTKSIGGRVNGLEPFSGGTYVFSIVAPTTSGGAPTKTLTALSNSGSVLWTITLS